MFVEAIEQVINVFVLMVIMMTVRVRIANNAFSNVDYVKMETLVVNVKVIEWQMIVSVEKDFMMIINQNNVKIVYRIAEFV